MNEKIDTIIPHSEDVLKTDEFNEIGTLTKFLIFEESIASELMPDPNHTEAINWAARKSAVDMLRPQKPQKFIGSIIDIALDPINDPRARLLDANKRGKKFVGALGTPRERTSEAAEKEARELTKGYVLTANLKSTKGGIIGQIQSEIWYVPSPTISSNDKSNMYSYPSRSIKRHMTQTSIEHFELPKRTEDSRNIGRAAIRQHPLVKTD